ncbi:hypothetical protein D3C87_1902100 [compost metagenome]
MRESSSLSIWITFVTGSDTKSTPAVAKLSSTGVVSAPWYASMLLYFTLKTGRAELDIIRNDSPPLLTVTISIGELPLPISATVRPFTCVPGLSSSIGKRTSGVQV